MRLMLAVVRFQCASTCVEVCGCCRRFREMCLDEHENEQQGFKVYRKRVATDDDDKEDDGDDNDDADDNDVVDYGSLGDQTDDNNDDHDD